MTTRRTPRPLKLEGASRPQKDIWDKISTLTVPLASLVVGTLGVYGTYTYNQADLRQKAQQAAADNALRVTQQQSAQQISQAQLLQQLFDFVASSDPQKREFGYQMYAAMGKGELASRLIALKNDKVGIPLLKKLALDTNPVVSTAAAESLASILRSQHSCEDFAMEGFRVDHVPASKGDYAIAAASLGVELPALLAFLQVEGNAAVLSDGRPRIIFERHIFSRLTDNKFDASHPDVSNTTPGGYGPSGPAQYSRLAEAAALSCPAALAATSWGRFQILGENYARAGYLYVDDFVKDVMSSEPKELQAGAYFLRSSGVVDALKAKDWAQVARRYNGPNYEMNHYAEHLEEAYAAAVAANRGAP